MNKENVLLEIKEFREAFNKIKPEEFYFGSFVKEFDLQHNCGTVCCLWGWIPKIAPEIAVRYKIYYDQYRLTTMSESPLVLQWPIRITKYLFYPGHVLQGFIALENDISLPDMLKAWDDVIFALEKTDRLDYLF